MVRNRKVTGNAASMGAGLALGAAVSMAVTIAFSLLTAKLVDSGSLAESGIGYAAMGILLLSSILGAMTAIRRIKRQRLVVCLASGGIYYALLLSMTALFFGGQYTGMGVTALVVAGGCGAVILAGMGQGGAGRKRKIKGLPR